MAFEGLNPKRRIYKYNFTYGKQKRKDVWFYEDLEELVECYFYCKSIGHEVFDCEKIKDIELIEIEELGDDIFESKNKE